MTDDLLLATLVRIEAKMERLSEELAEIRGARKTLVAIAAVGGAIAGAVASLLRGHRP
jgi:DNA-binding FrmR family transcriptional regulator